MVFYSTIVAQAQKIDLIGEKIVFTFSANQRSLRDAFEEKRSWLESVAQQATGRRFAVTSVHMADTLTAAGGAPAEKPDKKTALREQALADPGVQAMLEVFPADIRDVEEM